jgi:hypothetical protein
MVELELVRAKGRRRLYAVEGFGTLEFEGLTSRAATARAGEKSWRIGRRGFWGRRIEATDEVGAAVGSFEPRSLRRGGAVSWYGRALALRPASSWRERYALAEGDDELAVLDGKGWGRRPVRISVPDPGSLDPGLLLFAVFVVRGLADDSSAAAATVAGTTATG